jgi:hypothetical protein
MMGEIYWETKGKREYKGNRKCDLRKEEREIVNVF